MQLSKEVVEEFKEIYEKEFGEELSWQEAYDKAHRLIQFVSVILRKPTSL